jgi:hypothetical protein
MFWKSVFYTVALVLAILSYASAAQPDLPLLELQVDGHRIEVEIAANEANRHLGLMHRQSLSADRGMLFVFPEARKHCIWMKDTHIPLSIAFINDNNEIVSIADMQPHSLAFHCSPLPVRYALEMNKGWFLRKQISPGARISGLEKAVCPSKAKAGKRDLP